MIEVPRELHASDDPVTALRDFSAPFFGQNGLLIHARPLSPDELPVTIRQLLFHNDHMTEKLRCHYGHPILLNVHGDQLEGDTYQRHITLTLAGSGRVVEVGLVRIDLRYTTADVRAAILERKTPLGDVLIGADVLRRIEPRWYFRFGAGCPLLADFRDSRVRVAYGRLGMIYCNEAPAIELLEVVAERNDGSTEVLA